LRAQAVDFNLVVLKSERTFAITAQNSSTDSLLPHRSSNSAAVWSTGNDAMRLVLF
jgi:hypothetical protein